MPKRYETLQDILGLNDDYSKPEYSRVPMDEGMYMPDEPFTRAQNYVMAPPGGVEESPAPSARRTGVKGKLPLPSREAIFRVGALSDSGPVSLDKYSGALLNGASNPNRINVRPLPDAPAPAEEKSAPPVVPAATANAAPQQKPAQAPQIPPSLLERLRAARVADGVDSGTSSLGRLLMATSAQFGRDKAAPQLMEDYLNYQAKHDNPNTTNFKLEQDVVDGERKARADEEKMRLDRQKAALDEQKALAEKLKMQEELSTETPRAKFAQALGRKLGLSEKEVAQIPGGMYDELAKLWSSIEDRGSKEQMAAANREARSALAALARTNQIILSQMATDRAITTTGMNNQTSRANTDARIGSAEGIADKKITSQEGIADKRIASQEEIAQKRLQGQVDKLAHSERVRQEREDRKEQHALGKAVDGNVVAVTKAMDRLEAIRRKYGGYPGVGRLAGGGPALSEAAKEVRQLANIVATKWRHDIYGASLTGYELENAKQALGTVGLMKTEDEFQRGLNFLRDTNDAHLTSTYAGVSNPAVVGKFINQTGAHVRNHPDFDLDGSATEAFMQSLKGDADDLEVAPLTKK